MRQIIACSGCRRQLAADGRPPGSKLHCICGRVLEVPRSTCHEAAVVRCSACGSPRQEGEGGSCSYCGASLTLLERDLNTICHQCFTRVSDSARFCHSCGVTIAPVVGSGSETDFACPACGAEERLFSRQIGEQIPEVLECDGCAGLWIDHRTFRQLETQAKTEGLPPFLGDSDPERSSLVDLGNLKYRPCVQCGNLMNRLNYGRRSGVVVDICKQHGLWFDDRELARILTWVREGGADQSRMRDQDEARAEASRKRLQETFTVNEAQRMTASGSSWGLAAALGSIVGDLLGGFD